MYDKDRSESLERLRDDTGMGPRRPGEMREAIKSYQRQSDISDEEYNELPATQALHQEIKVSEGKRLEAAIGSLGLTKDELVRHFPAISENYSRIYRERILNGVDLKNPQTLEDNMFQLHFGTVLSLLESDETLSKEIISSWPEEYGKVMATYEQMKIARKK